jgi:hypothetical protein
MARLAESEYESEAIGLARMARSGPAAVMAGIRLADRIEAELAPERRSGVMTTFLRLMRDPEHNVAAVARAVLVTLTQGLPRGLSFEITGPEGTQDACRPRVTAHLLDLGQPVHASEELCPFFDPARRATVGARGERTSVRGKGVAGVAVRRIISCRPHINRHGTPRYRGEETVAYGRGSQVGINPFRLRWPPVWRMRMFEMIDGNDLPNSFSFASQLGHQ